jgi:(1->4)-alpha-D-glucan 1-alpha-D-glucosylmutase
VRRIQAYMRKALREAKAHTSWISPNVAYEEAVAAFVAALLDGADPTGFRADFEAFALPLLRPGLLNALSQTLLKLAAPGVPDFYQGSEMWEFSLVDPDNRRPVDFARRRGELERLDARDEPPAARADRLLRELEGGALKLFLISRGLRFRRAHRDLFERGDYRPLRARGARGDQVVAFARALDARTVVALAARHFTRLPWPPTGAAWEDGAFPVGEHGGAYRDVFTERTVQARPGEGGGELALAGVFAHLPFALLERVP